jgi:Mor family transcriptional regulator
MLDAENLAGIYREIASAVDVKTAIEIHKLFNGQQIAFPKRLFSKAFVHKYVKENYNGSNIRQLSQKMNYSDRRIRQILNEDV